MSQRETLDRLVRRVAAQVRWRRVEHYALRAGFWSVLGAAVVLLFKDALDTWALPLAAGVAGAGLLGGALWGATRRTTTADAARLADRAFGLEERVATALEWGARADRTPLVDALVADAAERVERLEPRSVVRRILPREARALACRHTSMRHTRASASRPDLRSPNSTMPAQILLPPMSISMATPSIVCSIVHLSPSLLIGFQLK